MKSFPRRSFLRGMSWGAGGVLLAPLLTRLAQSQAGPPCRFVFVVEGNCFEPVTMLSSGARAALDATMGNPIGTDRWWFRRYTHTGSPLVVPETDFAGASALGSILGTGSETSLVPNTTVLFGLSSRVTGGGHSAAHGVLSSSRSSAAAPGGQTIDAHLAELAAVRQGAPYDAVRLGVSGSVDKPLDYGTCAFGVGRAAALVLQPRAAFDMLFGSVASAAGQAVFQERRQLLDFARADVNAALAVFSGNSAERAKLESYLASLEANVARQQRMLDMEAQSQSLSTNMPPLPENNPLYAGTDPLDRLRAHLELATAALKGGLTNVVVVGSGTGGDFNMAYTSVSPVMRHDLHHQSGARPDYLAAIHEVTRLQVAAVARMARDLAATPEPGTDGTMLDHTVITYISDNGEQHHSTASEFPVLLIGGQALGLSSGGRTLLYPGVDHSGNRQVSNLWNTLGFCAGEELTHFGREGAARITPGPLSDLLTT
ncbi:MAG: DUF1552 domain-containing protein [Myxococcota bacterium]